jgi:MinD-like ATPase involved in chromosome partitioning or flagellar assembly
MADESKKTVFRRVVVPEEEKKKYLVGNTPPFLGKPFELTSNDFTIGREEGRDLQVPSEMVSRLHATIAPKDGQYLIVDNDSSNGTFLNNAPLEAMKPHVLNHRDVIKCDAFEFIFIDTACADLWQTLKPLSREGTQIIAVYSPKGGTGVTSIALNLAASLASSTKKSVAVADFDLRFGDVLTFSVGKPGLSIYDLIREPDITGETIGRFLQQGPGFSYLPAPSKLEYAELVKVDHIKKILWSLEAKFDFVIVDLKNEIDDLSIMAWELANQIVVVGNPEIGHMLALRKVLDVMNQFKYPETKVKLVINRVGRTGTLNIEEIKGFMKREFLTIPNSPEDAALTSHAGQLFVKERPDGSLAKALRDLEHSLRGEDVVAEQGGIFSKLKSILGF